MLETKTYYGPLSLKNTVIIAAAGTTENLELIKRAEEAGAAAVVMKTLFEEEFTRCNPTPCYSLIRRGSGPLRSATFYSFEQASPWGLERYAIEVYRAAREVAIPVIASINCVTDGAWADYAATLAEAGAAALELNRSCPFSTLMLDCGREESWTALASATLKLVKERVSIPVFVKMTPQLSDPLLAAATLERAGADGLVMFSRFTGLDLDLETEKPVMHGGFAGHGGTWAFHYALRWIAAAAPQLKVSISASGGVCCGDDLVKFILAGASSVQICTAIYVEGFKVIGPYLERLERFMEQKGYTSLEQFKGKACARVVSSEKVDRRKKAVAVVDAGKCTGCGLCTAVCLHGAVHQAEGTAAVQEAACAGCGLCVQLCPRAAIYMRAW